MGLRSDWDRLEAGEFLRKYAPIGEFIFVFVLIIAAIAWPKRIGLTWQLVALVFLLLVIPYVPLIKRISYGDWEAELETLVQSAEETVEGETEAAEDSDVKERAAKLGEMLNRQLEEDPKIALAKLRMELEDVLSDFAIQRGYDRDSEYIRFFEVVDFLRENAEVMDRDLYNDIRQVREVANEAIHGGEVNQKTARRIISVGLRVLERIYYEAETDINPDPSVPAFSREREIAE